MGKILIKIPLAFITILLTIITSSASAQQTQNDFQFIRTGPGLSLHKEMFMLPVTYSDKYNGAKTEAVFQVSAKHRLFSSRFYFAYTQISFWQAYDENNSAPFRETNYNPEIFYRFKVFSYWKGHIGADIGGEHQSNGQRPPISRSWNLLYVAPYYYNSKMLIYLKVRYRIPEDDKASPEDAIGDDNPDITDYLGYTDLRFMYRLPKNQSLDLMIRGFIGHGKGNACLYYNLPIPKSDNSYFTLRISYGYGESMVDYKERLFRVGAGVMFSR